MRKNPYITIEGRGKCELVVERSRFIGYAIPVRQLNSVEDELNAIRKEHYNARHVCYGLRFGVGATLIDRSNDDGEPARTGGFPLWQLLEGSSVTDALLVVVRYFGGVKLGTGGLSRAYRDCGRMALEDAHVVEVYPECEWAEVVPYRLLEVLEYRIGEVSSLRIVEKEYGADVVVRFAVRWGELELARKLLGELLQRSTEEIAAEL